MFKNNSTRLNVRIVRFALYALLPFFLLAAFMYDINLSGRRTYRYRMDVPVTTISKLFPAHRLAGIQKNEQRVLESPIYFTARYPHRYERARVTVDVENSQDLQWLIGVEVQGGDSWSYYLEVPDRNGIVEFSLDRAKVTGR